MNAVTMILGGFGVILIIFGWWQLNNKKYPEKQRALGTGFIVIGIMLLIVGIAMPIISSMVASGNFQ